MSHEDERQALLDEIATLKARAGEDGDVLRLFSDAADRREAVSTRLLLDKTEARVQLGWLRSARARLNSRKDEK